MTINTSDIRTPTSELLRSLPQIDTVLRAARDNPALSDYSDERITVVARAVIDDVRKAILEERADTRSVPTVDNVVTEIIRCLAEMSVHSLRPVINGTGIILHTNLGRAPMAESVADHVRAVAMEYSTLEYDLTAGGRGSRHSHVEQLLCDLTGAESCMVVNNNAAAVMLALAALCHGREVIVSRGEQVEVGGSFRIPDVMVQSGAILREVGSTNKTKIRDYKRAISPNAAALLKVHTSNYRVVGFTEEVTLPQLVELGKSHDVPTIYDLGSGAFDSKFSFGEPTILQAVASGADVVCFSGDKLLGGSQAGIILGTTAVIAAMKSHPLARANRIDKLSLAALEATLRLYMDSEKSVGRIPTLSMLAESVDIIKQRAQSLLAMVDGSMKLNFTIVETQVEVGGGSLPGVVLPSIALGITSDVLSSNQIERHMRGWKIPIIGRISQDTYLIDMRCVQERHFDEIVRALGEISL